MKPCSNKQAAIAMLAMGESDVRQELELRAHLETCEDCRQYYAEISHVRETLAGAEAAADIQTPEFFHRKVMARLRTEKRASVWDNVGRIFPASWLSWRVALPVAAVAVVLLGVLVAQLPRPTGTGSLPQSVSTSAPVAEADVLPTMANYQVAADQSLQKFDELLTQQARKPLPSAPVYTASMLTLGNGAD